MNELFPQVVAAVRAAARHRLPEKILPDHGFVTDLGFDSMSIALLALSLEDELGRAVLLDDWIATHTDPQSMTVESLCNYVSTDGAA